MFTIYKDKASKLCGSINYKLDQQRKKKEKFDVIKLSKMNYIFMEDNIF